MCGTSQIMSVEVALLLQRAVDVERDAPRDQDARSAPPDGCGAIGAACANDLPMSHGRFFSRIVALQVAARHVEADRVAEDERRSRLRPATLHARLADRHHELDLVVEVLGGQRIADAARRCRRHDGHDRVGRLGEEERRLLGGIAAHLLRVLGVVAADAIDVADREIARRCRRRARAGRSHAEMAYFMASSRLKECEAIRRRAGAPARRRRTRAARGTCASMRSERRDTARGRR